MDTHLHDLLDGPPLFADDPPDQVVVSQNFERYFRGFARVPRLLLHHLQDPAAGRAAVLRLPVHGDGLLQAGGVLHLAVAAIISLTLTLYKRKCWEGRLHPPVDVHPGPALLRDVADGCAAAADDGAHHVAGHQHPQREVHAAGPGPRTLPALARALATSARHFAWTGACLDSIHRYNQT